MPTADQNKHRDPRWPLIVTRDKRADGTFWYSVTTTGIYCRPSCPSRLAKPCNVVFHDTLAEARASGARPCLRCDPEGQSQRETGAHLIARACRMIEAADVQPDLAALASAAGLSASHFHRLFRAATGLTPKAYADAHRAGRLRAELKTAETVTGAIYGAGFGSSGRFYEKSARMLGMTPTRYRLGGKGETLRFAVGQCSLGAILVASSDKGVAAILLGDDPEALLHELQDAFPHAALKGGDPGYEAIVARVIGLIEAPRIGLDLPLDIRGTAFQQRVWQALQQIPAGKTATYAEIAERIGQPSAIRAVATACAANRHAVAIPCHRVIRTGGALSGYRWGIARKRQLLEIEKET